MSISYLEKQTINTMTDAAIKRALEAARRGAQIRATQGEEAYEKWQAQRQRKNKIGKIIGYTIGIAAVVGFYALVAWLLQLAYNAVAHSFSWPTLGYSGACGLLFLLCVCSLLVRESKS